MATTPISAAKFLALAKALYKTGSGIDARSQMLDTSTTPNLSRDYTSPQEVLDYLFNSNASIQALLRTGGFAILINSGGSLLNGVISGGTRNEYWFRDGVADSNLVLKQANVDLSALATTQALNYAINSLAPVAATGNYADLGNKPDLNQYATQTQLTTVATTLNQVSYSLAFRNPTTQAEDYFPHGGQIKSIVLRSGIATYAYSLNGGASWITPTLPLTGNIIIPADIVLIHRITYSVGTVTALLYIQLN